MSFTQKLYKGTMPVAPLMGFPGIQLTKTSIKKNLEDADVQFNTLRKLKQKFNPDAMFFMMDLSVEAEALGLKIRKPENESYTVIEHPIRNIEDLKDLFIPDPYKDARMPLFLDVIKRMSKEFLDIPNIAYCIGPFTLAGLMTGAEETLMNIILNPEFIEEEIKFTTRVIKDYGKALIDAGADAVCILEPTATVLSPQMFDNFSGKFIKELKESWSKPTILHICGDTSRIIPNMVKTGCDGLSLDYAVNLKEIRDEVPENIFIIGNINPVASIAYGKREDLENEVRELVENMKDRKTFILSSGCDIPSDANLDNIQLMIDIARTINF